MQMVCVALLPASQPLLGRRSVHSFFLVFPIATSRAASGHPPEGRVVLRLRAKFPQRKSIKNTHISWVKNPTGCEMTTCGIFFIKFRLVQSLALMAIVVFNASGVKEVLLQLFNKIIET